MVKKLLLVLLLALGLTAGSAGIAQAAVPRAVPAVSVGGLDPNTGGSVDTWT
jgi:hypothetical protein